MADETRRQIFTGLGAFCITAGRQPLKGNSLQRPDSHLAPSDENLRASLARVLGKMPTRPNSGFKVLESVDLPGGRRHKIEYLAETGDPVLATPNDYIRAYLFEPNHKSGQRLPAIVAIHQDGPQSHIGKSEPAGLIGDKNLFYGLELFQRGYVVICPDRFYHAERRRVVPNDLTRLTQNGTWIC